MLTTSDFKMLIIHMTRSFAHKLTRDITSN